MHREGAHYLAYLLRLWQSEEGEPWRASLESVGPGDRHGFADTEKLLEFLKEQMQTMERSLTVTRDDVFRALEANLRAQLSQAGVQNASSLRILGTSTPRDLGGNSWAIMEAIHATAHQLRVELPREDVLRARTIDDVLNVFAHALRLP